MRQKHTILEYILGVALVVVVLAVAYYAISFYQSQGALAMLANKYNTSQSVILDQNDAVNALGKKVAALQNYTKSQGSNISNQSFKIQALQNTIQNQNFTITNLQSQLTSANNQVTSLNSRVAALQGQVIGLQNQVSNLTKNINLQNTQVILQKSPGNVQLATPNKTGSNYTIQVTPSYCGDIGNKYIGSEFFWSIGKQWGFWWNLFQ